MLELVISMLKGMLPSIKDEVSKKITNKEIAPNVLKMFTIFFELVVGIFSKEETFKNKLIRQLPVLIATLGVILTDLLDEDTVTTDLLDINFD